MQVALLAATLLTATLAWAYRAGRTGRDRDASATGLLLAALALTDPILALAAAGVAWAVVLGRGSAAGASGRSPIVALASAAGRGPLGRAERVGPRRVRLHQEHVRLRLLAGQLRPQPGDRQGRPRVGRADPGRDEGQAGLRGLNETLWEARHEAGYIDDIALTAGDYRELASVSEPERSRRLFRRALRGPPGRARPLCPALPASAAVFRPLRRDEPQDPERRLSGEPPGA